MVDALIRLCDVAIGWGRPIQSHLSFEIPERSVFAILGGSGCGKSTLLRHLIGLQVPLHGSIEVMGRAPRQRFDQPPQYGVMFQSGALFGSLTLLENISVPLRQWTDLPRDAIAAIAAARLRLVGLAGFENHLPAEISGGMKKRAGIARALALDPPLLFLDEPSAGLDPITAVELDQLVLDLRRDLGVTTVLVTHELASIFKIADLCVMLDKQAGGAIAFGDPRQLRDESVDPRVQAFFRRTSRTDPRANKQETS